MPGSNFKAEVVANNYAILSQEAGLALYATCTGAPSTAAALFMPGCVMVRTDAGSGVKGVYENTGTTAVPVWNLMGDSSAGDLTLAQDNLLVGSATGVGEAIAFLKTAVTTVSSGAGAVAITGAIHEVTTTGTGDALTLVDGAEGQHLNVVYVAEGAGGDTAVLTPSNLAGANTTVTFNDLGDAAHLLFTAGDWYFLGGEAVVAA